jgi:hypothetical protein
MNILNGELSRQFSIKDVYGRPAIAGGTPVQLGDQKGMIFQRAPEYEALERWTARQFLEVERNIARQWRRALTAVDFEAMFRGGTSP